MSDERLTLGDIKQIHPFVGSGFARILALTECRCYDLRKVKYGLILNFGIFLTRSTSFNAKSVLKTISFKEIQGIEVATDKKRITIRRQRNPILFTYNPVLVETLCSYFAALYPTRPVVGFTPKKQEIMNIYIDRFAAGCGLHLTHADMINNFQKFCKNISEEKLCHVIERSMARVICSKPTQQMYLDALTDAIAHDAERKCLVIASPWKYHNIVPQIAMILKGNRFIKEITYDAVRFGGPSGSMCQFEGSVAPIRKVNWVNCGFVDPVSSWPLTPTFSQVASRIRKVLINECEFSDDNLVRFFEMLIECQCFDSLESIQIRKPGGKLGPLLHEQIVKYIYTSHNGQSMEKKLRKVIIDDVATLDVHSILEYLCGTGIRYVGLTSCCFTAALDVTRVSDFGALSSITLDGCNYSVDAMISFFTILSKSDVKRLSMNGMKQDLSCGSGFNNLYTRLSTIKVKCLKEISWNNNQIAAEDVDTFFSFLISLTAIRKISIENSLPSDCSARIRTGLGNLVRLRRRKPIIVGLSREDAAFYHTMVHGRRSINQYGDEAVQFETVEDVIGVLDQSADVYEMVNECKYLLRVTEDSVCEFARSLLLLEM